MGTLTRCTLLTCLTLSPSAAGAADAPGAREVVVMRPVARAVAPAATFRGRTEAAYRVELRARVSGYVTKIAFRDGDRIKQGDLLFEIDPRPYRAELDHAMAAVAAAEVKLRLADGDARRAERLLSNRAIDEWEAQKFALAREEAKAHLQAERAAADLARLRLSYTRVASPGSGRISGRQLDVGGLVRADVTTLATLVRLTPMYAAFDMDERTYLDLRRAEAANRKDGETLPRWPAAVGAPGEAGFPRQAIVESVDTRVEPAADGIRLRATFANADELLLPGMSVRVRIETGPARDTLLVPPTAVGPPGDKDRARLLKEPPPYAWVVNADDRVERRAVKAVPGPDGMFAVEHGLKADDWVIVEPDASLNPGDKVKPIRRESPERGKP